MSKSITQEMKFTTLHGNWYDAGPNFRKRVVQNIGDNTLSGNFLAAKLERVFLNIELKSWYKEGARRFTLLDVVFHNMWDYRISRVSAILVDSEGYQHSSLEPAYTFPLQKDLLPEGQDSFSPPDNEIESGCKTRGWTWFDSLTDELFPHRLIFKVNIHSPGETSGWVQDTETLEFIVAEYTIGPV